MTVWDYWNATAAAKGNLRLLVPGKGWVAYADREDNEGKVVERGSKEGIDSALINALSASNFSTLTGAGASLCARNADGQPQAASTRDFWNAVEAAVGPPVFAAVCGRFPNATIGPENRLTSNRGHSRRAGHWHQRNGGGLLAAVETRHGLKNHTSWVSIIDGYKRVGSRGEQLGSMPLGMSRRETSR